MIVTIIVLYWGGIIAMMTIVSFSWVWHNDGRVSYRIFGLGG